ncbi:hypothetical protein NDK47_12725 [Brevibacillus ruminantium]|uniref:Uncharacterized protein n=1 Tax=Brevibacillus ruminantium TaxID=2950604 RepID=A0ABY4WM19_9BACL|nr:hypothetical protein [Brevibacillus ruminantium]USG68088.1 hypothetical protein NDK47_12725 [Brevibacillus ruminantium]
MSFDQKFVFNVDQTKKVVSWKVNADLTIEDSKKARDLIVGAISKFQNGEVNLLIDNRNMIQNGKPIVFKPEVNEIWEQTQKDIFPKVSKCAVLCCSVIMKMQMDRIARSSGISEVQKSFWNDDPSVMKKEAYDFLGISSNALVDAV